MTEYKAPLQDMRFVMYEVFSAAEKWAQWSANTAIDQDTADAILEECAKLSSRVIAPLNRSGDEEGCHWQNGQVITPKGYKSAFKSYAELGLIGLCGNPEFGGMGLPKVLAAQCDEMLCSASLAFILYPSLTFGVTLALDAHGSETLKNRYLPKLYSGEWAGTMCLTEPHAGTDLGLIKTKAIDNNDGSYAISGTKIFITGGDHDLTDNIVHLVLAKLPDAPAGTKGISMFLVPKINISEEGILEGGNAVSCGSIEHKMGIKASSTCVMNFDGAKGYLVGEKNKGLAAMFTMMNYERLFVGIQGLGCSEMSYQTALSYAKDRLQGRAASGGSGSTSKKEKAADPIFAHGDVRRMLLNTKALNEAGRAFSTYVANQLDTSKFSNDNQEKQLASNKVALLTPVAKAFFTDMGLESCIAGQQVLGGHGYISEWGQEQLVRDVRITQIYEGTNGVQALDLLGRKILANGGQYFNEFITEVRRSLAESELEILSTPLTKATDRLEGLTNTLMEKAKADPNLINSACVDYLHAFSYVTYGWMWLIMAETAAKKLKENPANNSLDTANGSLNTANGSFYKAKLTTARHYFTRLLPRLYSLADIAESETEHLYSLPDDQF